jgi:hypothetical protein
MESIRESRLPMDFVNALNVCDQWPGLAKWALQHSRRMATAVLTYGGDVSRGISHCFPPSQDARLIGDARISNVFGAPPVRENTHVSIGLSNNWGQLCMSAAWNNSVLSAQDCERFLDLYRDTWLQWCESPAAR